MELIILGKAPIEESVQGLKKDNNEVWMCGTDTRNGGDLYFELHGIEIKNHENVIYKLPDEVYEQGFPINNTISALLVYAYLQKYKKIRIIGCPTLAEDEYIKQRPALAYIVGYMNGKGLEVTWDSLPDNINYGKQ